MNKIGAMLVAAVALLSGSGVQAQDSYPNKPIRLVVGFAAGGGNDILARLFNTKLGEALGQPVIVENRPGAGAVVATEYVAKSPPDGYTLLIGASGAMAINPAVYTKLTYDTLRDFAPITMIASFPLFVVATPTLPVGTIQDLITFTKANPGKANYAGSSPAFQLATELFKLRTGTAMEYIGYKSSGESVTAVIKGEVLMSIVDAPAVSGHIRGGQVRALAVTSPNRSPDFPNLPTLRESGVPDADVGLWSGIFAPAGTPAPIVRKLEAEARRVLRMPEVHDRLLGLSVEPSASSAEDFAKVIRFDIDRWTAVAKSANIKIEP